MMYASNADLPEAIRNALPDDGQNLWRTIFEAYMGKHNDQKTASATAWVGIRKQGWEKTKEGWVNKNTGVSFDDVNTLQKDSPTSSGVHVNRPIGEKEDDEENKKAFVFKIADMNTEKRLAFGWSVISRDALGNEVWDLQDDGIDPEDLEALAYKYVRFYRDSGELHVNAGKAVLIESVVTTVEKQRVWGIPSGVMPVGWWTGFYVLDDAVWEKVKSGEYSAFSIEGTAVRQKV